VLPGRKYTPDEIFRLVRQWKWLILIPWMLISAGTVAFVRTLPDRYRSESIIQVVPQRVPENLVKSTVTAKIEERLPAISQQILSRTRLERIIQDFGLYAKERKTELMEDVVKGMRDDIHVNMVKGDAFQVAYESNDAKTAMKVTERVASLFVEENLRDREVLAEGANQFLDSQLDDARRRLLEHEKKLEEYRQKYSGELPNQVQGNLQSLSGLEGQIQAFNESLNRDRDRRLVLERIIAEASADSSAATSVPSNREKEPETSGSAAMQLEAAKNALEAMQLRLKPQHPDIARMRRTIRDLEKKAESEALQAPLSSGEVKSTNPAEMFRQNQIKSAKMEMEILDRQMANKLESQKKLQGAIPEFQRRIAAGPARESELTALSRDYETLQKVYTNLLSKSEDARVSANLERRQIGEQFKVIDAARLPERPFSPNRPQMNLGGVAAGLVVGFLLIGFIEYRDTSFRSEDDIVTVLALPVLATIPAILTKEDKRKAFKVRVVVASATTFVFLCGGAAFMLRSRILEMFR
jgi:polysaccharide chain length determinant protein (PEP-CTERM system associated)